MSKKHSNRDKQLDFQVVTLLRDQGIFNQVRAKTLSNLAVEIQSSSFDSLKCYKTIKSDNDYQLASQIVFEYLKKHNMEYTINCIQSETKNQLRPTPISDDIQNELNISQKENVLYHVLQYYNGNLTDIFTKYHESIINDVNERISNIGKSKPKTTEKKSPKATTAPISRSNSKSSVTQDQISKTQNPTKKEESSSIGFDLNDDDIPTPSKAPNTKSSTQKVKSESSEIDFNDTSDFDKPAPSKPAASTQPAKSVKKASESEFSDFDDDIDLEDNAPPPAKQNKSPNQAKPKNDDDDFDVDFDIDDNPAPAPKQNKSPNQSKPKNEMDDFFDDDQEPPLMTKNPAKAPPKNDDFEDDSLLDVTDSL